MRGETGFHPSAPSPTRRRTRAAGSPALDRTGRQPIQRHGHQRRYTSSSMSLARPVGEPSRWRTAAATRAASSASCAPPGAPTARLRSRPSTGAPGRGAHGRGQRRGVGRRRDEDEGGTRTSASPARPAAHGPVGGHSSFSRSGPVAVASPPKHLSELLRTLALGVAASIRPRSNPAAVSAARRRGPAPSDSRPRRCATRSR
jgi:hypothetical protein